ncbi:MAG: hypothetical protein OSJ45_04025 [Lachnospiraceae bacterium]|nr:hypothetical protein [Lachnospiraceae bacterium]
MTPLELLEALKKYCKEITKNMRFFARVPENGTQAAKRCPAVFIGGLPDKNSERKAAPYILLKLLTGKDDDEESTCRVRIICLTYSENKEENYIQCLNLVTQIKTRLLEDVVVDNHFSCQKPVEFIVYDDSLEVYQIGEIMTIWEMPKVERDVSKYLAQGAYTPKQYVTTMEIDTKKYSMQGDK